ncbi:MAG: efflux RND transporter periplasmic adaptor subunit [Planctomycetes bacterium]|nr:efflux RND transporter periplasmic adaptor subunit [Planctomycetota bacterium]
MVKAKILARALCFILCLIVFSSCSQKEPPKARQARLATVTVTKPAEERVERIITAIGTLDLEDEVNVATEVGGLIKEVRFEEGQEISPGDILVVLDETNFKLNVDKANAALDKATSGLSLAEDNYNRAKTLKEKELISNQEYQEATLALQNAKSDLAGAQTNCRIAQRALDFSVIKAPFRGRGISGSTENGQSRDGVPAGEFPKGKYTWEVQKKLVSVGEYLNTGSPVAELVNRTTLKLRFTVPEREARYLAMGKAVKFTTLAAPGDFKAVIFYIAPNIIESTRAVTVKAYVDNKDHVLRAGYSANVSFVGELSEKAMMISRRSLRFDVDKSYVLVVMDGVLKKKDVTIGIEHDEYVEITSGLSLTDKVVVRSGSFLEDGTKVEVIPDSPVGTPVPQSRPEWQGSPEAADKPENKKDK